MRRLGIRPVDFVRAAERGFPASSDTDPRPSDRTTAPTAAGGSRPRPATDHVLAPGALRRAKA